MNFRWLNLVVALVLVVLANGCAPKAMFTVTQPAQLDINGIERLVILDFDGPQDSGKIVRGALTAQFWDNHYYTLVDQAELSRVHPITTPTGTTDVAAAIDASRQIGVDAILTGQVVSYAVNDDKQHNTNFNVLGGGSSSKAGNSSGGLGVGFESNESLNREASVGLAFKLIDVRTGAIRAAKEVSHNFNGRSVNGDVQLPGRERILADLSSKCTREVLTMLAPHPVPNNVVLARQYYGRGLSELKKGNSLAQKGNWGAAEVAWETALQQSHQNHAAMYNLALAAEARGDYPTAIRRIEQAIDEYGDSLYHEYRKRLEQNRGQFLAAMSQVNAKNTLLASRQQPPQSIPFINPASPPPLQGPQVNPQQGPQPARFEEIAPPAANLPPPPTFPQQ